MGRKMASIEASSLSPSVMSWFGQELETRGIDAVIYTRYILSILQQEDPSDVEHWEAQFFPPCKKSQAAASVQVEPSPPPTTSSSPANGTRGRGSGKGRKSEKKKGGISTEELRKSAAVECLLSVSDEESGIESLVEELYLKLKEHEALKDSVAATVLCNCHLTESSSESCDSGTDDPAERYYAAFPALSTQAESVKPAAVTVQPANSVWATSKHLLGNWPNDRDSGSSSRDSSGERPDVEENEEKNEEIKGQDSGYQNKFKGTSRRKTDTGSYTTSVKKTVTFDEKLVQLQRGPFSGGGKRRRGHYCRGYDDDSDKENHKGKNRGHHLHHHGNQREQWDNSASDTAGDTGRLKMKSPRGASSWAGSEPKFVVPRIKSHLSPSGVKMKMRSDDLASPLWAELVFSSDEEFDKVISESTSINSVIRRLLNRGKKWRSVDFENQAWYTDPIDFLWPSSPSQRLYKRQSSMPDVSGLNLSKIFEESDQDEGFFGVGEEHQSAALNVIAVLFGTDGKKESPFKHLLRIKDEEQDEEGQQDESSEYTVQFEMEMDNDRSGENSDRESLPRDPCSSENLSELLESLTGCSACSQLQQETSNIGASHMNSPFVSEANDSQRPRGDPLYRRRSSGIATGTGGGTEGNATNIPKSTENQVPDDRPDSGDLNLEELFQLSSLPTTVQQDQTECGDILQQNQSSTIHSSSSSSPLSSSFSVYNNTSSDSFSLPSNIITSGLPSNPNTFSLQNNSNMLTGSCLNSVNSDYSVFGAQTLPVVVVASGLDIQSTCQCETDEDDAIPKATFHWTLDDSTCQEDAGEAPLSPLVSEPCEGATEQGHNLATFEFPHINHETAVEDSSTESEEPGNPQLLSSLCLSQLGVEGTPAPVVLLVDSSPERYISPPALQLPQENQQIDLADGCGESLISPLIQHLDVQARHIRGASLSSDDGDGQEVSSLPVGPRVDSVELRLNLDFILDNSDDEEDYGTCVPIDFCEPNTSYHGDMRPSENEALSAPEEFQDLQTELKLNLDFIDDEDNPGDLSLEDVFIPDPPQANNSGSEEADKMQLGLSTNSLATTKSSICDKVANCESKTNDIDTMTSAVKNTVDQNNSLLYFFNGDFGIWSSVLESVAARSPHHFWPAEFTQAGDRSSSVLRLPTDCSEFWGTSAGSIFLSAGNPWGTTWLPISPRRDEDTNQNILECRPTSRLWDVNLQKISSEFESPRERCSTIENIQHYLMNLRFSGSSPFHSQNSAVGGPVSSMFCESSSAFISGGIYSIKLDSESSIWALNHSSLWGRHSVLDWNRRSVLDWDRHSVFDYPQSTTFSESPLFHLTPPQEDSDPGLWNNFSTKSRLIHRCSSSLENLVDSGSHEHGVIHHNTLRRVHPNLLPSENSAFSDITPPRLPHLPHVRSDPALSVNSVLRHQQYQQLDCNGRKLVQVKSLYKSDNSVLSQLGLTTGEASPLRSEQLHYSPDTHFKPITTPDTTTQQVQCQHKPEDDESPIPIYVGRSSSYQWYHEGETLTTTKKPFIPRFKVNKGSEKYIQTGESIEEVEEEALSDGEEYRCVTPTLNSNPIELLLSDMQDVLEIADGADTEKLVLETMESYESFSSTPRGFVENSSDYESMATGDPSIDDFGNLAELWDAQVSGGGECHVEDTAITSAPDIKSAYQTIWSCGTEPAIPNPVLKRSSNVHSPDDGKGSNLQQDHVQMYSLQNLCAQPVSMESVDGDSGDEGDDGSPATKDTTPIALETLPFIMESSDVLSEASLQAFLDSGLPGYIPEFPQMPSEEAQLAQRVPQDSWISDEDDADDVLDLIEMRKHWTTPTEGLDLLDEQGNNIESSTSHIMPNTWDLSGKSDGDMWSFSDAEKLKQWLTFESKNMHDLKCRWSDIHDHGNQWVQQQDGESHGNNGSSSKKSSGIPHTWSVDRDLSALWADNVDHIKGMTMDHNENPINLEEHAQSWPLQQYLNNYGNRHWLSAAEETIMYPSDWIVDERSRCANEQQPVVQEDVGHSMSVQNNNKPCPSTKHWSLGDQGDEEPFTESDVHRHFSLQDGDLKTKPWNPNTDDGDGLESLWINPHGMETSSDSIATDTEHQGNRDGPTDTCADLRRIWSDSEDKTESGARPQWLSVSDDVFLTENLSDEQSPEAVFTCGEGPPPKEQAVYSDQLEQSWMTGSHFQVQVPRKANRPKLAPSQKPCSYFMEGNCRRMDCKFAHDMSSITCRFWEDGGCFKGVTCPFLHGYPESLGEVERDEESDKSDSGSDFYLDDEEFPQLGKSDVEPHPAQVAAEKRRKLRHELEEKQRMAFLAYRKKEKEKTTTNTPAPPLAKTASEVDKESNEKVI